MTRRSVEEVVALVLGIDPGAVTDATSPRDVESWDSFNGLMLVTELEKEFGVSFHIDEITGVQNVGDIKKALRNHGVAI